jgi:hypothetical protein
VTPIIVNPRRNGNEERRSRATTLAIIGDA